MINPKIYVIIPSIIDVTNQLIALSILSILLCAFLALRYASFAVFFARLAVSCTLVMSSIFVSTRTRRSLISVKISWSLIFVLPYFCIQISLLDFFFFHLFQLFI